MSEARLRQSVSGAVVIVTGASSGIGAATARRLGRAGATVLLVARREPLLVALRDEIELAGGRAEVWACDLNDARAVDALVAGVLEAHGCVDVVVSNAGLSIHRWISGSYERFHDIERTANVNYLGPARLMVGLVRPMRARRAGHIVSVGTVAAYVGAPGWTAYLASKTALDTWVRGVAPEVAADGVTMTRIYMPLVDTPMLGSFWLFDHHRPRMTAEQAAGWVCRAVVERPRLLAPWWWRAATIPLQLLADRPFQALTRWYARRADPARRAGPEQQP